MLLNNENLKQSLATYTHIFDKSSDKNHIAFKTKATVVTRSLGIIFAVLALGASTQSLSFTFYAWATAVFVCLSILLLTTRVLLVFTTANKGCYYSISILGIKHKQPAYLHSKGFTIEPDTELQKKWRLVGAANQRYLLSSRSEAESLAVNLALWLSTNAYIKTHSGAEPMLITEQTSQASNDDNVDLSIDDFTPVSWRVKDYAKLILPFFVLFLFANMLRLL